MKRISASLLSGLLFLLASCEEKIRPDPAPFPINIAECLVETGNTSFDIMTWNLEEFPMQGVHTTENVSDIISALDADLIALQEIADINDFNSLVAGLEGWKGYVDHTNGLSLAYLYKEDEVSLTGDPEPLFRNDSYVFPRPPLFVSATHTNGISLFLINIHLKCCDGEENVDRRKEAARFLKEYIDEKLPGKPVMILGDFNDEISLSASGENAFYTFIEDSLNYEFTDMDIAMGGQDSWSYPGWPSHIDHILISDELFSHEVLTTTLTFDNCDPAYINYISDHRPLMIRLEP